MEQGTAFLVIIGAFAVLFFVMAMFMNGKVKTIESARLPAEGGLLKPFVISKHNTVVEIKVTQSLKRKFNWIYNYCDVLDTEGESVYGFGKEFWWESGYDEGHWEEKDITLKTKITFPFPGTYQLKFSTERSPGEDRSMNIHVVTRRGSGLLGITIAIVLVLFIIFMAYLWSNDFEVGPPQRKNTLLGVTGFMSIAFIIVTYFSLQGWGYPGYYGYHQNPSWTYFNGSVEYYPERSLRDGSVYGPNRKGGGPNSGK
jgi:NADH:ubiquinone oxidoreductase subunit 6 (subunit J)